MNFARVTVTPEALSPIFFGHEMKELRSSMPKDAKMVSVFWDAEQMAAVFVFSSSEFDPVPEGGTPPNFVPVFDDGTQSSPIPYSEDEV